ncbi:MAG: DUF2141 domain-containing protein [Bacteroidota bacterium]
MKKHFVLLLLLSCGGWTAAQDLTVHLKDIKSPGEGRLVFMLYDSADGFPREHDKALHKVLITDFSSSASHTFENIPVGKYAVVVMQDKNENKELDKNFMGMPKEPVGVSNMEGFGRPTFEKSAFNLTAAGKTIELRFMNE